MTGTLSNKVAVVVGGAGFIGTAVCRALGEQSAAVVVADVDDVKLTNTCQALERDGINVLGIRTDVCDPNDITALIDNTYAVFNRADFLVNVAAIAPITPILDITLDEWNMVFQTNTTSIFLLSRVFAKRAIERKIAGRIVNITSAAARVVRPDVSHYAASKAAVDTLTRSFAIELAPYGFHVHAVSPGLTENDYNERVRRERPGEHEAKMARIPFGRMGKPEEAAAVVAFLLGPGANYMTGCIIDSDGGFVLGIPSYDALAAS